RRRRKRRIRRQKREQTKRNRKQKRKRATRTRSSMKKKRTIVSIALNRSPRPSFLTSPRKGRSVLQCRKTERLSSFRRNAPSTNSTKRQAHYNSVQTAPTALFIFVPSFCGYVVAMSH